MNTTEFPALNFQPIVTSSKTYLVFDQNHTEALAQRTAGSGA